VWRAETLVSCEAVNRDRPVAPVRVAPGGEEFRVIVTDDTDGSDRIELVAGPWRCK
jgi:hypothetical protein